MKWNLLYCLCQPFIMDTFCGGRLQYKWFLHRDFTPNMVSQRSNWDITTLQTIPSHCLAMAFADYTGPLPKGEGEDSVGWGGGGGCWTTRRNGNLWLGFPEMMVSPLWKMSSQSRLDAFWKCLPEELVFQKYLSSRRTCLLEDLSSRGTWLPEGLVF